MNLDNKFNYEVAMTSHIEAPEVWKVGKYPYFQTCSADFFPTKEDLENYKKQFKWKKWGE